VRGRPNLLRGILFVSALYLADLIRFLAAIRSVFFSVTRLMSLPFVNRNSAGELSRTPHLVDVSASRCTQRQTLLFDGCLFGLHETQRRPLVWTGKN
jgi:hypothetical protein